MYLKNIWSLWLEYFPEAGIRKLIKYRIIIPYCIKIFLFFQDTRTHVVVELYDTERSYVESLHTLVNVSNSYFIAYFIAQQSSINQ